jgi:hypothetical protein
MQRHLGKEYENLAYRRKFLEDNADGVVEKGYMKPFATEKVVELKEKLAETSIEIGEIEAEKKAATTRYNAQLKPLRDEKATILRGIKERAEYVKENCYKFVDQEDRMVGFYNAEGDLIESRPAAPDELQGTIFQIKRNDRLKNGTEN